MHCETQLDEGFFYIGGSDRRIHLFENVYPLTNGVSYNSYLYLDEKTVLLDTVDRSVSGVFYDNLEFLIKRPETRLLDREPYGTGSCGQYWGAPPPLSGRHHHRECDVGTFPYLKRRLFR
jgi:hypothetical protein